MKSKRAAICIVVVIGIGTALFIASKNLSVTVTEEGDIQEAVPITIESEAPTDVSANVTDSPLTPSPDFRIARQDDGSVDYIPSIETSKDLKVGNAPEENLYVIDQLFFHYRFAYGENPVGVENFEITEQLLGKNPKRIRFISADAELLDDNELVDQWGTPYFFHPQSGQKMDIQSAGPDRIMWSEDDVILGKEE